MIPFLSCHRRARPARLPRRAGLVRSAFLCAILLAPLAGRAQEAAPRGAEGFVNFSFDQVDVSAFVKLVGEMTGRKFALGDGVQGKITVVSPQVKRAEVYPLFVTILESVGCSVVQDGDVYRVITMPPRASPMAPVVGEGDKLPEAGIVTRIIRLQNVSASEVRKMLEGRVIGGKAGAVVAMEETNHLIVTDTTESIRRIEKIIAEIDRPGLARVTEVVALEYASAESLADQLSQALLERESRGEQLAQRLPQVAGASGGGGSMPAVVVASPHANSLILVGTQVQLLSLKEIIKQMDKDTPAGRGRLNAVFLKYLVAADAAKSISALLDKSQGKDEKLLKRKTISLEADAANNALLIDAMPSDFDLIKKLIEQLDKVPQQVHISVLIAEVSKSEGLNLGVEMAALNMPSGVGDTVIQGSSTLNDSSGLMNAIQQGILPGGLSIGVAHGTSIDASGKVVSGWPGIVNINAVKKNGHFEILSETALEAQNNKEASVNIVNQIPILKSTIQGGSGTARDVIQNIDRVDVGIKLKLTPHIIPGGEVQMVLNPTIEAVVDAGSSSTQFTPTIAKREVSTTVTVPDGRTIVIAGLTRKDQKQTEKRVPILGSIPLIGRLFRNTVDSADKTDLLIFVTPRIIDSMVTADHILDNWSDKTGLKPDEQH